MSHCRVTFAPGAEIIVRNFRTIANDSKWPPSTRLQILQEAVVVLQLADNSAIRLYGHLYLWATIDANVKYIVLSS